MTIELMRHVDYWVGIPLCFALNSFNFFARLIDLFKKRGLPQYKKILYIKLSEMGAIILAYSLIKKMREEHSEAGIFFLTFKKNKEIFQALGEIVPDANVLTIRDESLISFSFDTVKAIRRLRRENIDITFDLEFFSRFTAVLAYLTGGKKRVGFSRYSFEGLYRGNLFTHAIAYNPLLHISETYLSLHQTITNDRKNSPELKETVADNTIQAPHFISNEETRKGVLEKIKPYKISGDTRLILVNPGEGMLPLREWSLKNFTYICKELLNDEKNYICIAGTANKYKKEIRLHAALNNPRCINLVGKTSIIELLELFSLAHILIANDCGLSHIAALTSIEKFIIFGPESPQIFSPLDEHTQLLYARMPCSPCLSVLNHRNSRCKNNICLQAVDPRDVLMRIKKFL
ncbi:MAG: glycosyltransferase family 9 protein [Candidatus Omnitrophica bacterium]|nr:glycosyltransferase family 9 protein [Candidatus Omnitrophota bacterium]